jgi:hypothetical protein
MRLQDQNADALRDHVFSTYITLRYGLVVVGVLYPVALWAIGAFVYGIEWRPSMSHYYFAPYPEAPLEKVFPMRVWFVGPLCAIATGLALYKGFTNWENVALNLAGVFALLVALFPMNVDCTVECGPSLHGTAAILLFACLAFVAVFCAQATLAYLPEPGRRTWFRRRYKVLGVAMLASPLAALALTLATRNESRFIFVAEALGVWCFAAYWWVKSREMAESSAEKQALEAKIAPPRRQSGRFLPTFSVETEDTSGRG